MSLLPRVRARVIDRDGGCVAPLLDPDAGVCRDRWGDVRPRDWYEALTAEHVLPDGGLRRASYHDEAHVLALCYGHHLGAGPTDPLRPAIWALANKDLSRTYLAGLYPLAWAKETP